MIDGIPISPLGLDDLRMSLSIIPQVIYIYAVFGFSLSERGCVTHLSARKIAFFVSQPSTQSHKHIWIVGKVSNQTRTKKNRLLCDLMNHSRTTFYISLR